MVTDQINHAPAMTKLMTGHQLPGRPSLGAWTSYGLGSENQNLPDYLVLISKMKRPSDQPLYETKIVNSRAFQRTAQRDEDD